MADGPKKSVDVIYEEIITHIDGEIIRMTPTGRKMMVDSIMIHLRAFPKKWKEELPGT